MKVYTFVTNKRLSFKTNTILSFKKDAETLLALGIKEIVRFGVVLKEEDDFRFFLVVLDDDIQALEMFPQLLEEDSILSDVLYTYLHKGKFVTKLTKTLSRMDLPKRDLSDTLRSYEHAYSVSSYGQLVPAV